MSPAARALRSAVRLYQKVTAGRPSPCRFVPTCSYYALDALDAHGAVAAERSPCGGWSAATPWGGHGWDPVPEGKHH